MSDWTAWFQSSVNTIRRNNDDFGTRRPEQTPGKKEHRIKKVAGKILPVDSCFRMSAPSTGLKITFGSQSFLGAQALATNLSLITTAKRQGRDPLGLIKPILLRDFDTPLSDLYAPGNLPTSDSS